MPETYSESERTPEQQKNIGVRRFSGEDVSSTMNNKNNNDNDLSTEQFTESTNDIRYFDPPKAQKQKIPFWLENPNVLFQSDYMFEFFPVESMMYSQKLNAITRTPFYIRPLIRLG